MTRCGMIHLHCLDDNHRLAEKLGASGTQGSWLIPELPDGRKQLGDLAIWCGKLHHGKGSKV